MKKSDAIGKALSLDGDLTPREVSELYDHARSSSGPIMEIGDDHGRGIAALAYGAMAGDRQCVHSIRPHGDDLRKRLDGVGINGMVRIQDTHNHPSVPFASMLYVGSRRWPTLSLGDIVSDGGTVVSRERSTVVDHVSGDTAWIPAGEIESLRLAIKRSSQEPLEVMLALPGGSLQWNTVLAVMSLVDGFHHIQTTNSGNGWDDFNTVWCRALNAMEAGKITHFAQLHSDIAPQGHWLDILLEELTRNDLAMVSAISPIKDTRGVTSSGIGDPDNCWEPYRRFTMAEVCEMPQTFTASDIGYPGRALMHNTGCFVCDLRKPLFTQTDDDGVAEVTFDFPTMVKRKEDGEFEAYRESEDWYFSRRVHELGGKTAITRKVRLQHRGVMDFNNFEPWGKYRDGDEDTAYKWRANE